jgi:phosphoribosylformylglycinamidine synthase
LKTRIEIEYLSQLKIPEHLRLPFKSIASDFKGPIERAFYMMDWGDAAPENVAERVRGVFGDSILYRLHEADKSENGEEGFVAEISFLAGVTDNPARSAADALALFGEAPEVASGKLYFFMGKEIDRERLTALVTQTLCNPLIEKAEIFSMEEFRARERFKSVSLPVVKLSHSKETDSFPLLSLDLEQVKHLADTRCLALSMDELIHAKSYFSDPEVQEQRKKVGLPIDPTEVEIEIIAQSWSEHCKHKIFQAHIDYLEDTDANGKKIGNQRVESLYKSTIKRATKEIEKERDLKWLISVFSDNAGVVRFDKKLDVCVKVETHNSPSALDPYGGALTGILGVNRDIMGTGLGARPIANTDVFCVGMPDDPRPGHEGAMPAGLMTPARLLEGVHRGVEDGGNKSGIPTVAGAIVYDQDYSGKPLVFCGTVGVMPHTLPDGRGSCEKAARPGDLIVVVGGAVGADGIHGATFSSLELDENSPATAVQIGDPLTQKRVCDFLIEARDLGLFSGITDNGAGGISSSVGEMARESNGAVLDLAKCPLKYPGLAPWEIMISESQERMGLAVPPEKWEALNDLARRRSVVASSIGHFNNSGNFEIFYGPERVASLSLEFLHESLPPMQLKARWQGPRLRGAWYPERIKKEMPKTLALLVKSALPDLLSSANIRSKAPLVRQYDHEVGGATHIKPFAVGESLKTEGPNNAGVIWTAPHGGEEEGALFIGMGLCPRVSLWDPMLMAIRSVDEAIRNVVAHGADPEKLCLLDNFCWPDPVVSAKNPDGERKLAELVRTCTGLYEACKAYGAPLVSGKDSMKNDFRGKTKQGNPLVVSVLPTLLVTALAHGHIDRTSTSDIKAAGTKIYLVGNAGRGLFASELAELYQCEASALSEENLGLNAKTFKAIYLAHQNQLIHACHDISDGGLLCAVAEMLFAHQRGAKLVINGELATADALFNESGGRFIIAVEKHREEQFLQTFKDIQVTCLGESTHSEKLEIELLNEGLSFSIAELTRAWGGMK